MTIGAGAAITLAAQPASAHVPTPLFYVFGAMAIIGFYGMLAPLLHLPPWRRRVTARSTANGSLSAPEPRQRPSTETTKPVGECDAELRTLLVAGQNVSDSYQSRTSFSRQWDEAAKREHLLWTRDAISLVCRCYPAVMEKFEAASSHQERMAILADLLGNEEE
jgi:hypothetical protein